MTAMAQARVVIVGAGAAGLSAASSLLNGAGALDLQVTILEASSYVGGRILVDCHWKDVGPVDMGAEFVHGEKSIIAEMAKKQHWHLDKVVEHGDSVNRAHGFHMENKLGMLWDKSNSAMAETLSLMAKLDSLSWRANRRDHRAIRESTDGSDGVPSESESSGDDEGSLEDMNDCTMLELCQRLQVSEAAMSVFKANVLQTEGSSWQLSGLADYGQNWDDGDFDLWLRDTYYILLKHYLQSLSTSHVSIETSCKVVAVETKDDAGLKNGMVVRYQPGGSDDNKEMECDFVILTAPVTVLQRNIIEFRPPLPEAVRHAIDSLPMLNAVKVYMRFSQHFWPQTLKVWECASGVLSQYWTRIISKTERQSSVDSTDFPYSNLIGGCSADKFVVRVKRSDVSNLPTQPASSEDNPAVAHLVCGFATADVADAACRHDTATLVRMSLSQLDDIFREHSGVENIASSCFQSAIVCDWSKHPHVLGGYSGQCMGGVRHRSRLSRPLFNARLHLAGEATHVQPRCVQAAIATGERAANQVIEAAQGKAGHKLEESCSVL